MVHLADELMPIPAIPDAAFAAARSAGAPEAPQAESARDELQQWLVTLFADGPRDAWDIFAMGLERGLSPVRLRRARIAAGILVRRQGFGPGAKYQWHLPTATDD